MEELEELIAEMKSKMQSRDLSDEYLSNNGNFTRSDIGIGEYSYGITMIPCKWIVGYLEDYLKLINNIKGAIDSSIYADAHEYGDLYMVSTEVLEEILEKCNTRKENKND